MVELLGSHQVGGLKDNELKEGTTDSKGGSHEALHRLRNRQHARQEAELPRGGLAEGMQSQPISS